MFAEARGTRIWYDVCGPDDGPPVVLLHGWGAQAQTMASIGSCLAGTYRVYVLDFPGFGQSPPPPVVWAVGDYMEALRELVAHWGIQRAIFIGHSHGGRVAIKLAALYPQQVERLVLVDAAGILPRRTARSYALTVAARAGSALFSLPGLATHGEALREWAAQRFGSSDYAAAGPLRDTLVRVVNEDLTPLLRRIQASTLLIWGDGDQDTPVSDGQLMEREIPDAGLVILSPAGHYSFLDKPAEFCTIVRHFLAADLTAASPAVAPQPMARGGAQTAAPRRGKVAPVTRRTALAGLTLAAGALGILAIAWLAVARLGAASVWSAGLLLFAALPWVLHGIRREIGFLHVLQLEEYEVGRFVRWLGTNRARVVAPVDIIIALVLLTLALACAPLRDSGVAVVPLIVAWPLSGLYLLSARRPVSAKKPLVYTRKAGIVLVLAAATGIMVALIVVWLALVVPGQPSMAARLYLALCAAVFGTWLVAQGAALNVITGNALLYPGQAAAKRRIVHRAGARLRARPDLIVIGISGTYGKTSVKEILATILESRYRVLKTPESYNTPLGISRVVLHDLRPDHQVFVCEMGSYEPGDIAYLCRLAAPRMGILTSVGMMHLERFKTIEAIARTDYELIEALPSTGLAIFNADNEWCRRLAAETADKEVICTGIDAAAGVHLWASGITTSATGMAFSVHDRSGASVPFRVQLLGRHNVGNVLMATAAALACGMTLGEVGKAVARVRPVPHRLQLISGTVTTIDDTYNANPESVAAGLAVLAEIQGGRKVLVTPGMVELGPREAEENREFGRRAAAICDTVILVGPRRTLPIQEGLRDRGFPADNTVVVRTLAEATAYFTQILRPGDVILLANDLPDHYAE